MENSQSCCRICGVCFDISRSPTIQEINDKGRDAIENITSRRMSCDVHNECMNLYSTSASIITGLYSSDEDEDASYCPDSSSDDESLEYDSDSDNGSFEDHQEITGGSPAEMHDHVDSQRCPRSQKHREAIYELLREHARKSTFYGMERIIVNPADLNPKFEYMKIGELVAGSECRRKVAYNGHFITLQEMKGRTTRQCLMYKTEGWTPLPDDEDFELEGEIFLTGLSDRMSLGPGRYGYKGVTPRRHGILMPPANEIVSKDRQKVAMPFHPTCLEIYKHASRLLSKPPTIHDLFSWHNVEGLYEFVMTFPRDSAVRSCKEGLSWYHHQGTEWLSANPVFIPALPSVVQSAISMDPDFSYKSFAFPSLSSRPLSPQISPSKDLLHRLPPELKEAILAHLPSKDIASLRLASRAFTQFSQACFRRILRSEMPWLWEVYDSTPPSFWATVTASDLRFRQLRRLSRPIREKSHGKKLSLQRRIIQEEMPEIYTQWIAAEGTFDDTFDDMMKTGFEEGIDTQKLDWYKLSTEITRGMKDGRLKGLQNRKRIWKDIEEILRRIKHYKETGWEAVEPEYWDQNLS